MNQVEQMLKKIVQIFFRTYFSFMKKFDTLIIISFSALVIYVLFQISALQFDFNFRAFLPKKSVYTKDLIETEKKFASSEEPIVLILQSKTPWINERGLYNLNQLHEEFSKISNFQVFSLANYSVLVDDGKQINTKFFVDFKENIAKKITEQNSFIKPNFLSHNKKKTVFYFIPKNEKASLELVKHRIPSILKAKGWQKDISHRWAGLPFFKEESIEQLSSEFSKSFLISMLLTALVFFALFKNFAPVGLILTQMTFSFSAVALYLILSKTHINLLLITLPVLITVQTLTLCLHGILRVSTSTGWNKEFVLLRTIRKIFFSCTLITVCVMVGFGCLLYESNDLIRNFGVTVASGLFLSWAVFCLTYYPLQLKFSRPELRKMPILDKGPLHYVLKYRKFAVYSFPALIIVALLAFMQLNWSARTFEEISSKSNSYQAIKELDQSLFGSVGMEIVLHSKKGPILNDPKNLKKIFAYLNKLRKVNEIKTVHTFFDHYQIKDRMQVRKPASLAEIQEINFLSSMERPEFLRQYLSIDEKSLRIPLRMSDQGYDEMRKVYRKLRLEYSRSGLPFQLKLTGFGYAVPHINQAVVKSLLSGFWISLAVILCLLLVIFRSWKWVLISLLPNLVPPALLLIFLGMTRVPLTPSIAIIFSISLGFAFNNTIFFLMNAKKRYRAGQNPAKWLYRSLKEEYFPCFVAVLCLIGCCLSFVQSNFESTQNFGILMVLTMLGGIWGDLIFLPALLHFLRTRRSKLL